MKSPNPVEKEKKGGTVPKSLMENIAVRLSASEDQPLERPAKKFRSYFRARARARDVRSRTILKFARNERTSSRKKKGNEQRKERKAGVL